MKKRDDYLYGQNLNAKQRIAGVLAERAMMTPREIEAHWLNHEADKQLYGGDIVNQWLIRAYRRHL